MIFHDLEPFIILPYKDKQDILFYSNDLMMEFSESIKSMVYSELQNKIVRNNLIKVTVRYNYIVVFHIYPTDFKEKCSGRCGQNLIIGYLIRKKTLIKGFDIIINEIKSFFDSVQNCVNKKDVPTSFLTSINYGDELYIKRKLDDCIENTNQVLTGHYRCYNFLKRKKSVYKIRSYKKFMCEDKNLTSYQKLKYVYRHIVKHCIIDKEFWILVDYKDEFCYSLRNIHIINFIKDCS